MNSDDDKKELQFVQHFLSEHKKKHSHHQAKDLEINQTKRPAHTQTYTELF